jgi:predicted RNA-binding Zn-ribbon protein involved in translation (DUF1610 family)
MTRRLTDDQADAYAEHFWNGEAPAFPAQEAQENAEERFGYVRPPCPECGESMRPVGRGATLRKHGPRWTCPRSVGEGWDRRHRSAGRVWDEPSLDAWHTAEWDR